MKSQHFSFAAKAIASDQSTAAKNSRNAGRLQVTSNYREIRGIEKFTLLPSSIIKGVSQREKKISFFELEIGSKLRLLGFRREIKISQSVGRKLSHTMSDCAAATKVVETTDDLQASDGVVNDKILATTPSGSEEKSEISSPFSSSSINSKTEE